MTKIVKNRENFLKSTWPLLQKVKNSKKNRKKSEKN